MNGSLEITERIYNMLKGRITEVEKRELESWIALSPANKDEFEDIKLLLEGRNENGEHSPDSKFYDGLRKIKQIIRDRADAKIRRRVLIFFLIAVSVIVLIIFLNDRKRQKSPKFENVGLSYSDYRRNEKMVIRLS